METGEGAKLTYVPAATLMTSPLKLWLSAYSKVKQGLPIKQAPESVPVVATNRSTAKAFAQKHNKNNRAFLFGFSC